MLESSSNTYIRRFRLYGVLRPFSKVFPTHLFACSEHAGRWLFGNRVFDAGKVTVIRNAIDTERFRFSPEIRERVQRDFGIVDKFVVGHVGRFMPQKNHMFLLDVFAEVHKQNEDSMLMLVGDGELKAAVEEKVRRLGLMDNVMFLGARDDVHELYQAMDVFVLPSLYEGVPVTGVEAQCAGLPCVLSTQVPEEAMASEECERIRLEAAIEDWVKAILNVKKRANVPLQATKAELEIEYAANGLGRKYLTIVSNENGLQERSKLDVGRYPHHEK